MWTYSHICQGHEMTEHSRAGLEKAGTCSYSPSWADPAQVPGTVWGAHHHCKGLIDEGISTRFQDLVGAKGRPAAGSRAQPSPTPSLRAVSQLAASHRAPDPCGTVIRNRSLPLFSVSLLFSGLTSSLDWLARLNDCEGQWSPAYVCPAFTTNAD